jgi:NTP pyrophosphatase (non-canonical NTP hydrolase)
MQIQELSKLMDRFVTEKGWYQTGSPKPQTLRNIAISLNLEASEVLEHFQWQEEPVNRTELAGELADVALYLFQLASLAEIDLENAILVKLEQNYRRSWDRDEVK